MKKGIREKAVTALTGWSIAHQATYSKRVKDTSRLEYQDKTASAPPAAPGTDQSNAGDPLPSPRPRFSLGRAVRLVVRKILRGLYSFFFRPFVRPAARRLRSFLNEGRSDELAALKSEIMQLQQQLHQQAFSETHSTARTIVSVIDARHQGGLEAMQQEQRQLLLDMTQGWQLIRDFVKNDIRMARIAADAQNQAVLDQLRSLSLQLGEAVAAAGRGSAQDITAATTRVLKRVDTTADTMRRDIAQIVAEKIAVTDARSGVDDILRRLQRLATDIRSDLDTSLSTLASSADVRQLSGDLTEQWRSASVTLQDSLTAVTASMASTDDVQRAAEGLTGQLHASITALQQGFAATAEGRASIDDLRALAADIAERLQTIAADIRQDIAGATASAAAAQVNANKVSAADVQKAANDIIARLDIAAGNLREGVDSVGAHLARSTQALSANFAAGATEAQRTVKSQLDRRFAQLDRIESYGYATARRAAVNCGPDEVLIKTTVGYVLCKASDHAVLACLLDTGDIERGTRLLIQKFLRPGNGFVDVGANLGLHTLAAAQAMQGKGRIFAFEPFAPTKLLLERSVFINGFAGISDVRQAAVGTASGERKLFLGATSGHHSVYPLYNDASDPLAVSVPSVRLDSVIPADCTVDLIKIDVEGAELEVLESAKTTITRNDDIALIVEFGPSHLKRTGQLVSDWLGAFAALGFEYKAIDAMTGALENLTLAQLEAIESVNLFFARTGSPAWEKAGGRA